MDSCVVCGGVEFYTESGFYFCQQCETQQEGRREEVVEYAADASTYVTKKKIDRRSKLADTKETALGWTSWETFNFILNGWTNELILLGATPEFKITVLQLWATYLGKLQVAFRSFSDKSLPRLPLFYRKKDSEIVFGAVSSRVRKRKRAPSSGTSEGGSTHASDLSFGRLLSQRRRKLVDLEYQKYLDTSESETDGASSANQSLHSMKSDALQPKKRKVPVYLNAFAIANKRKAMGNSKKCLRMKRGDPRVGRLHAHRGTVEHLTMQDVLAVVNLALRINNEKIHLSDVLRFQVEGHMSSKKLDHFFPDEDPLPNDLKRTVYTLNKYEGIRDATGDLAHLLGVSQIPEPNIVELIQRYCTDLQLPKGIALYAERMIAMSPPKLTFEKWNYSLPRYEAKAMSAIIIVMKILFGLDGVTEYEISRVVDRINSIAEEKDALDSKLFSFIEWQRYIECRRSVIMSHHSATRYRLDPEAPSQNVNEYLNYLSKFVTPAEPGVLLKQVTENINKNMENLAENLPEVEPVRSFQPSLTPMHSYLQELLMDDDVDLPSILRQDFTSAKVGYMTNTETFKDLSKECGIDLEIIDSSASFVERIVPIFDPEIYYPKTEDLSKPTPVVIHTRGIARRDDPLEYLHLKTPGKITIDETKRSLYSKNLRHSQRAKRRSAQDFDDFAFDEVRSNGKLDIAEFDDSDSEEEDPQSSVLSDESLLLSNYERLSLKGGARSHWHRVKITKLQQSEEKRFSGARKQAEATESCDCVMCENESENEGEDEDDDLSIIKEVSRSGSNDEKDEISILSERRSESGAEKATAFRPYRDYWLYRREATSNKGSHVEWHRLERDLPVNFRWLLNECAGMIQIEGGLLYQELAVVEAYYADCVVQDYDLERAKKFYGVTKHRYKAMVTTMRKKWNNVDRRVKRS
ncbi:TATA box-binding protein-associated factor RNA polymerase I subunit B [Diachasma alloeum]|uniref:TATA box-binding protein-associated factor RNA polymerase I subunit B n=1 Tax=Diachasma alloeum TaxID=454923 RepID=UPI0007382440|nr:TATA box-binding protein-associated factor RNA polymerase I subunit B [Diachasma alloeum]